MYVYACINIVDTKISDKYKKYVFSNHNYTIPVMK